MWKFLCKVGSSKIEYDFRKSSSDCFKMKLLDAKWCWSFLSGVLGNAGQCWAMLGYAGQWPSLSLCFQTELEILPTRHYPTQVLWTHLNIVLYSEERNLDNSDENQHLDLDAEWRALRAFIGSNWAPAKVEWPPVWSQETPSCDLGRHHLVFSGDTMVWSWETPWCDLGGHHGGTSEGNFLVSNDLRMIF